MIPSEFRQRYSDCLTALRQTRIVALGAAIAFDNFPNRLPGTLPADLKKVLVDFSRDLIEAVALARARGETVVVEPKVDALPAEHRALGENTIQMILSYWLGKKDAGAEHPPKPDFRSVVNAQELVMLLAHVDGFFADSLRWMCVACPRLLCREKKVSWEDVVKAGTYDSLIAQLVEEYVYEFGWRSVPEKVEYLRAVHGLSIPTASIAVNAIGEAELVRHLVVHNACRVSQEYVKRSGRTDVQVGETISIQEDFTGRVAKAAEVLVGDVFRAVVAKYFDVDEKGVNA